MDEYGLDLVEVSSHSGARPLCAKDQGKIFNRNGGGGYTTDLDGKRIKFYAWRSSSYGKPAGLLGINCGHQIYPFLPGISVQTYFPYDEKENAEQYEKICNQRALERKVRASKRECTSLDTLGDKEGFDKAAYKLKQQEQQLKSYCEKNGLTYKPDRTATPGYGRSQAAKTTASYKAAVKAEQEKIKQLEIDKAEKDAIIKEKENSFHSDLKNGNIKKEIDENHQKKHITGKVWKQQVKQALDDIKKNPDSKQKPKSRLLDNIDPQTIVDNYAGTGELEFRKNSKYPDEFIELPFDVGVTFDKRLGRYVKTRTIQIKYSDRGTHVFPTKGRGDK